jgi:hypothetical protein
VGQAEHTDAATGKPLDAAEIRGHDLAALDAGEAAYRGRVHGGHRLRRRASTCVRGDASTAITAWNRSRRPSVLSRCRRGTVTGRRHRVAGARRPPCQAPAGRRDPSVDPIQERLGDGQVVVERGRRDAEGPEVQRGERAPEVVEARRDGEADDVEAAEPSPRQVDVSVVESRHEAAPEERCADQQVDYGHPVVEGGHLGWHRPGPGPDGPVERPVDDPVDHSPGCSCP